MGGCAWRSCREVRPAFQTTPDCPRRCVLGVQRPANLANYILGYMSLVAVEARRPLTLQ